MPQPADAAIHLIDMIYGSLFGECSWQGFLDAVAKTSPDGKAALHYHDLASPVAHVPYISGFTKDEVDQFSNHFASVNPWIPRMGLVPVGRGLCGEDIFARKNLVKTEFYNDWLKRQAGCETSIGVSIIREEARTFILSTATSSSDPERNRKAAERYTLLAPHLKRAFDFIRKRDLLAPDNQALRTLFDSIGAGLIYVSDKRKVRWSNRTAENIIAAGFPFRVAADGRISIRCQKSAAAFEWLASRHDGQRGPYTAIVQGDGKEGSYRLTIVRLQSSAFTEFLEGPTVAVIAEPIVAAPLKDRQNALMETSKLTVTEIKVALSVASGNTPREVATAYQISYETVRTHLRNIYSKLGVNSQVALAALLLGS
ncbi:helix-turn-helix transcriptional regulator [Rhizobium sp. BE258]|uniref:helix-turn-helix transcriptional regulator n=1 Tax=Rhizobium sp. BE258 TaxID=2817722 RepID=UPI00285ECE56|nr:helix-turn-helix transcriptional regulator [Rhizobium sp. BE258]MDR7144154.1 DNA-binding CsgD family transcriptional regulator [Rhizobium sp. BE258]